MASLNVSSNVAQQANRLIHDVYVWMVANDELVLKPFELTLLQFRALELIHDLDLPNLITLSDAMLTSKSTVTRIIDYLERSGWVSRHADHTDRRNFRLRLTDDGINHLTAVHKAFHESLHRRFLILPTGELEHFTKMLNLLREYFLSTLSNPPENQP